MQLPGYAPKIKRGHGVIHAAAASVPSIMDYALQRLQRIPANKHVLVLQYDTPDPACYHSEGALKERTLWLVKAKARSIPVVDTFDVLTKAKASQNPLWIGQMKAPPDPCTHHTSYGNEIIAQAILDSGVLD